MKGIFFLTMGAVTGVLAVRRVSRAARAFTPASLQDNLTGLAGGLQASMLEFIEEVRMGMAEREEELRTALGLDGSHDLVDAAPAHTPAPAYVSTPVAALERGEHR